MTNKLLLISEEDDGNVIFLRYEPQEESQQGTPSLKSRILQWFGRLSTLALGVAVFAPNMLHISAGFRPWIFVTFILWVVAFCAGMFNS